MTLHRTSPTVVKVPALRGPVRATVTLLIDSFFLLPIGVLVALVWANTAGVSYFRFAHTLRFIVNDVGMVFFVGMVTEEALEAVMPGGALHRWRRTLLPIVAAVGGVLGATAIYVFYLRERSEFMLLEGWPVAAAQDVALAYFIAKQSSSGGGVRSVFFSSWRLSAMRSRSSAPHSGIRRTPTRCPSPSA